MLVRASIGTLALLGFYSVRLDERPFTAYLLQYSRDGCLAGCIFCPQSRSNLQVDKELLSRIPWPVVELEEIVEKLRESRVFSRVCVESVLKKRFIDEMLEIAEYIVSSGIDIPLSIAVTPVHRKYLVELEKTGVDRLGIGLDAATPSVFVAVRKPYTWRTYMWFIESALDVFGEHRVEVHLIRGLGETEREFVETMAMLMEMGVDIALFALTPVKGTLVEKYRQPSIESYRRIQLIRYLLSRGMKLEDIVFFAGDKACLKKHVVEEVLSNFDEYAGAFLTSGCPGCNRPFYNERTRGPFYNMPSHRFMRKHYELLYKEVEKALMECSQSG